MKGKFTKNNLIISAIGLLAIGFGVLTLKSGGFALFGGESGRQFAGKYVSFVLWFNFIAGFFYILSGLGIFFKKHWGVTIAKILALSTIIIFLAFAVTIFSGLDYEMRTVGAMTLRSTFWVVVFMFSKKLIPIV